MSGPSPGLLQETAQANMDAEAAQARVAGAKLAAGRNRRRVDMIRDFVHDLVEVSKDGVNGSPFAQTAAASEPGICAVRECGLAQDWTAG